MITTLALYPPEAYEIGLTVVTSSIRVLPPDCLDPRLKATGKYVCNIMAKQEANRAGAGEALMLNSQGTIAECTGDNLFIVRGNELFTPHPSCGILKGITRDTAIEIAREMGMVIHETFLTPFDLFAADEAFLTGTAAQVIPMVSLDGKPIGCGKPGPCTMRIMARYAEITKSTGVPFDKA
jgi:branched-chain amino acid aminotransferase